MIIKLIRRLDNQVLIDLVFGNVLFLAFGEIILTIIFGFRADILLGYLLGVIMSVCMVFHMAIAIDDSVRMDENTALKHIRKTYIIRSVAVLAVFFTVWYTGVINPIAMVFGLLILKLSAYAQPITNRLTSKIYSKGR